MTEKRSAGLGALVYATSLCIGNLFGGRTKKKGEENIITTPIKQLRDPFILTENGVYYMYGTGWVCYKNTSGSLTGPWENLGVVVSVPEDAVKDLWAPEVHKYNGEYYMFTTYMSKKRGKRGCAVFRSSKPEGPFAEISNGHVTPNDWYAIDGTFYVDDEGQPWMIFVREWVGTKDKIGRMVAAKMSPDLTHLTSEPVELFRADDPIWAARGITDGPFLYRTESGELLMTWSNFDSHGYCVGIARSDNGRPDGKWTQEDKQLYSATMGKYEGGHGMIFTSLEGKLYFSFHAPNHRVGRRKETPVFIPLRKENGTLIWDADAGD